MPDFQDTGRHIGLWLVTFLLLMGIPAAAYAEGNFRVEGKNITESKEIEVEKDTDFHFLYTTKSGTKVKILCKDYSSTSSFLFVSGTFKLVLLYKTCEVYLNGELANGCTPKGSPEAKLKGGLILESGKTYGLVSPSEGTIFISFSLGEECAIGEKITVTGSAILEDCSGSFETEVVKRLVKFPPPFVADGVSVASAVSATIESSMWLKLKGPDTGKKWSALG
jgi:hypothetical protein